MQNRELIKTLQQGEGTDNIILVAEENLFVIKDIANAEGSIMLIIEPILDADDYKMKIISQTNTQTNNAPDITDGIDVFGDLGSVNIGG